MSDAAADPALAKNGQPNPVLMGHPMIKKDSFLYKQPSKHFNQILTRIQIKNSNWNSGRNVNQNRIGIRVENGTFEWEF